MKKILYSLIFVFVLSAANSCSKDDLPIMKENVEKYDPVSIAKGNSMQLYVHYMPWFENKASNEGEWGMHWTMSNMDPDIIDESGKRQIASHYYPLIGPYASSDKDVIRYHLLLMKYSGIDGILIDWYGTQQKNDYASNNRNTEEIVKLLAEVGLKFAIVYEDQTLKEIADEEAKVYQAKEDFKYMETQFFSQKEYIQIDNKPLLLVFGPQDINEPAKWSDIIATTKVKPHFLTLYGHSGTTNNADHKNASGEYIWVDATDMDKKYEAKDKYDLFIGGAYPGFKDFYPEGGWGDHVLAPIDHANGQLFTNLLQKAQDNKVDYLQLITWNDFGEGTMIEPTMEFGYTFLTQLQTFSKVSYKQDMLETILELYELKQTVKHRELVSKLEQAFYCLYAEKVEEAKTLINEVKKY